MRQVAALFLFVAGACGGGDRQGLTADSAVLQSGSGVIDSAGGIATAMVDSGPSDTLVVDSIAPHNPTVVLVADSVAGDELFRRKGKCLSCHGLAGKGLRGLGPTLQDSIWLHGDGSFAFIRGTITNGIARPKESNLAMPAFGRAPDADASLLSTTLSAEEIYRIAAYVFTLSHPGSTVADTTTVVRDTSAVPRDSVPPVLVVPPPLARSRTADPLLDRPFIR